MPKRFNCPLKVQPSWPWHQCAAKSKDSRALNMPLFDKLKSSPFKREKQNLPSEGKFFLKTGM